MIDRQTVIANVLGFHKQPSGNVRVCSCGVVVDWGTSISYRAHVAAEINSALDATELPPFRVMQVERRSDSPPHDWHPATSYSVTDSPRGAEILIADKYRITVPPAGAALPEREPTPEPSAWSDVLAERERQKSKEGYSTAHDDGHTDEALALRAGLYALPRTLRGKVDNDGKPLAWPWDVCDWKPSPQNRRRELIKAGALILAEIERLDRLASPVGSAAGEKPEPSSARKQFDAIMATVSAGACVHGTPFTREEACAECVKSGETADPYFVLGFCEAAIKDAIMLDDGLDGGAGNGTTTQYVEQERTHPRAHPHRSRGHSTAESLG